MPAKKTASKKRTKATTSRKKVVAKNVSKKKSTKKKSPGKQSAKKAGSRKQASVKKPSKKKAAAKSASKKKAAKKSVSKKKTATKSVSKKKVAKKSVSKKKAAEKSVSKKKVAAKAGKKVGKKKAIAERAAVSRPPAKRSRSRGDVLTGPIHGIEPYKTRRGEEYMSEGQLEHFRKILTAWKRELMFEVDRTVHHMQDEAANFPDPNDRATQESEFGLELRTRDRERKLLRKIDAALARIDDGSYGFCDETGEEIGLKRLEARPVATLCLEAQERRELAERQFRDRDDRYR
jgi:DnaK suppressor protein